jgi:hypothetical protein|tara:strand:- start:1664 stop:2008 length:345 start_codon:yes stop_codon:yes gene_type:complete
MTDKQVSAKTEVDGKVVGPVTVNYDFGATTEEKIKLFGEDCTNSNAEASMTVALQDIIRNGLKAGKSAAAIQKTVSEWKPGVKRKARSKAEKVRDEFASLSAEEKKALLAQLTN